MTPFEIVKIINDKYQSIVNIENGQISNLDVIEVIAPKKLTFDFHYWDPNQFSYIANAVELIKKIYPNCKIQFNDVDEIMLKYNLVKTF